MKIPLLLIVAAGLVITVPGLLLTYVIHADSETMRLVGHMAGSVGAALCISGLFGLYRWAQSDQVK